MVGLVRRLSLGARLATGFGLVLVLTSVAAVVGFSASHVQHDAANRAARLNALARQILDLNQHNAAINGTQSWYMWDVVANGPAQALAPQAQPRNWFLSEKQATLELLDQIDTGVMTREQRDILDSIRTALDEFLAFDDRIVAAYRAGDIAEGNRIFTGADYYTPVAVATASLVESTTEAADGATREATESADKARLLIIIVLIGSVVIAGLIGWVVTRSLTVPIRRLVGTMRRLADRDLTLSSDAETRSGDEVADMERAVAEAVTTVRHAVVTMADTAAIIRNATAHATTTNSEAVSDTRGTAAQAGLVAGIAEEVSRNTRIVLDGAEEMGISIRQIAHNADEAARVAAGAVNAANRTTETVNKLGDSSQEISNVVKLITSIAQQTNLLALNATIEAARAGAAGTGFAVVANEVKDLAQATAKATEDIAQRVEAIQSDTTGAVTAIAEINDIIEQINQYQATIAAAVQEQTDTTSEMRSSVTQIAAGSERMAATVGAVAEHFTGTLDSLNTTERAVADLTAASRRLDEIVRTFRGGTEPPG
jgi:methyl-accepting chemotaxis protein